MPVVGGLSSAAAWPGAVAVTLRQASMRWPAKLRREASPRLLVRVLEGVPCADARMQVLARDGGWNDHAHPSPRACDVSFEPTLAWAGGAQVGRRVVGFEAWMRPDLDLCVRPSCARHSWQNPVLPTLTARSSACLDLIPSDTACDMPHSSSTTTRTSAHHFASDIIRPRQPLHA